MTGDPIHLRARRAVEAVLNAHQGEWLWFGTILRYVPEFSQRAVEGALKRLVAEGLATSSGGHRVCEQSFAACDGHTFGCLSHERLPGRGAR